MAVTSRGWNSHVYFASHGLTNHIIGSNHGEHPIWINNTEYEFEWNQVTHYRALWKYLKDILIPTMLNDNHYDATAGRYIYNYYSVILGGIRIRQYRASASAVCHHQDVEFQCYDHDGDEDKSSIYIQDPNDANNDITVEWKSSDENKEAPYLIGLHGVYYGSGQVVILPLNKTEALSTLNLLESGNFFDGQTRLISVDFTLYNPSINTHTVARIWFETLEAGDIERHYHINTWEFLRNEDFALRVFEIVFVIFVVGWTVLLAFKIYAICKYEENKLSRWDRMDFISLMFYWGYIAFEIAQFIDELDTNFVSVDEFHSYQYSEYLITMENYCLMTNGALLFLRVFKYLRGSERLSFMLLLFMDAAVDISIIFFSLFIVLLAFALCGFLFLASNVSEFRTIWHAIGSLIRSVVDPMQYHRMVRNHPIAGTFFFVIWNLIILLVLINIFIAVISQSYVKIWEERGDDETKLSLKEILSLWKQKMITGLGQDEKKEKKKKKMIAYNGGNTDMEVQRVQQLFQELLEEHESDQIKKDKLVKMFEQVLNDQEENDKNEDVDIEIVNVKRAKRAIQKAFADGLLFDVNENKIDEDELGEEQEERAEEILSEDFAQRDRIIQFAHSIDSNAISWQDLTDQEQADMMLDYLGGDKSKEWQTYSSYSELDRAKFDRLFNFIVKMINDESNM